MILDINTNQNIINSVEAFLYSNVVVPYNAAVVGTDFNKKIKIMMDQPDNMNVVLDVPFIAMEEPEDTGKQPVSTGLADGMVWQENRLFFRVYPALRQETDGSERPDRAAASILKSLFMKVSTTLTFPINDYYQAGNPMVEGAYVTEARMIPIHGSISYLATDAHRFDYAFGFKYPVVSLNG